MEAASRRWAALQAHRSTSEEKWREYSGYTLPYILPPRDGEARDLEEQAPQDSLGAAAVNQLSNRVADTLFPVSAQTGFFKLDLTATAERNVHRVLGQNAQQMLQKIGEAAAGAERDAMQRLSEISHRSSAVTALKLLIVTGNALVVHPDADKRSTAVYSPMSYVLDRDLTGELTELILRVETEFRALPQDVQDALKRLPKVYKPTTKVQLYTRFTREGEKFVGEQWADDHKTDWNNTYPESAFPYMVLTWNLRTGDRWGRGLVEEFASTFHSLDILKAAVVQVAAIAADIKFLVSPESVLDPADLQRSRSGSYHMGSATDISTTNVNTKLPDMMFVNSVIDGMEEQIRSAFMMNMQVRNAERVTATELRMQAQELERSLGGIYSHFSVEWQLPLANLVLRDVGYAPDENMRPLVLTGLATLSRTMDVERMALVMQDLGMLQAIPPELRDWFDPLRIVRMLAEGRGIDATKFMLSEEEYTQMQQQRQQQAIQQQEQAVQMQLAATAAEQEIQSDAG